MMQLPDGADVEAQLAHEINTEIHVVPTHVVIFVTLILHTSIRGTLGSGGSCDEFFLVPADDIYVILYRKTLF